ncbi:hypothetical protein AN189_17675 [Loktanella sp. 3ANDIMAR09]|uniref:glycine-rich domain-containing protein n=1 Tax=Loktanella sp. 3ANDIMAR09 TaxID=1225657 RepID=UPI0006F38376|nr:hypothetical protein [Loktanella sp. 3ANDIMAR09]KQI67052.1 hypothetical protein AN189_17675 [Loktanella sp. 3ANDIMAR09]
MPRPTTPTLVPYTDTLPDINNPATWATTNPPLWTWQTGENVTNQNKVVTYGDAVADYIDTALDGAETVVDSVAQLQLGRTMGEPTIYDTAGTGTYDVPAGATGLLVEAVGGGGAGGSASGSAGVARSAGGGGGGAYGRFMLTSLATSYSYTVGAAGVPAAAGDNTGGDGGNTLFGDAVIPGGKGGAGSGAFDVPVYVTPTSADTPVPSGVTFVAAHRGWRGESGFKTSAATRRSGQGGGSPMGTGGASLQTVSAGTSVAGNPGSGRGSGGSGAVAGDGSSGGLFGQAGGAGTAGKIIITPLF